MVMVYRLNCLQTEDEGSLTCFATREYVLRTKLRAEWAEGWDLQPSRLDAQGRYYPAKDPFAPGWSKFG